MGYTDYNKEMNRYMKERYHRRRSDWMERLGGVCVKCGSDNDLEFDHIDPETKEYPIAKILSGGSEAKVIAEMSKCQLLCKDCHLEKSRVDISIIHKGRCANG